MGGYFFFSILSGVLFTARRLSRKSLKGKMLLAIFCFVALWLVMAGVFTVFLMAFTILCNTGELYSGSISSYGVKKYIFNLLFPLLLLYTT